ncbi:MAG: hypothetical protein IPP90_07900 [Gemmatimonadaceae bacterium]|nr:hypothetical protein [Gemmatimonadaceae bacterium]
MREPQAASTLGIVRHAWRRVSPPFRRRTGVHRIGTFAVATMLAIGALMPTCLQGQIRRPVDTGPNYGWWLSGGAGSASISTDITDGVSRSKWHFGSDPLWQYRATLEKAIDEFTTLGIAAGYGPVDVLLSSIAGGANGKLPAACQVSCAATTELWSGMVQFRSGGGTGFHTLFEASGGGTAFRNFKTKTDAIAIPGIKSSLDLSGTLGAGFGYPLSPGMVIALVQDFGIGFHTKAELPEGTGRSWRMRNTRASLRIRFGGR